MNYHLKFYAAWLCALIAVSMLCFTAMAWNNPAQTPPAGNAAGPINTSGVAQTKAGDLNLGAKLNVAGDFASGRFCLAGECCATWEECFPAPATPPTCSCGSWEFVPAPANSCGVEDSVEKQTRTCYPAGCDLERRCIRVKYTPPGGQGNNCTADDQCGGPAYYCDLYDGKCVLRETISDAEWCGYNEIGCGEVWDSYKGAMRNCGDCSSGCTGIPETCGCWDNECFGPGYD